MNVLNNIKNAFLSFLTFFPTRLPRGMTEFHAWAGNIIKLGNFPITDVDSIKFVLATLVQRLNPTEDRKPIRYFIKSVNAAASKQIAGAVFYEIKEKQQAEATASAQQVAANEVLRNS